MAETYDETAELENARALLFSSRSAALPLRPDTIDNDTPHSVKEEMGNFGFSSEEPFATGDARGVENSPEFLVPISHAATIPVDDELLTTQTQSSSEDGHDFGDSKQANLQGELEPDAIDSLESEEDGRFVGEDPAHPDHQRTKRRVEENGGTSAVVGEYDEDFVNEIVGLTNSTEETVRQAEELDENVSLLAHFAKLTEHSAGKTSYLDFASVFHASRVKKLFRAGWGSGCEAKLENESDGNCPLVSSDAVMTISHAAALFVDDMVKQSAEQTTKRGKKTVTYEDVAVTVSTLDRLSFLSEVAPPEQAPLSTFSHSRSHIAPTNTTHEREKATGRAGKPKKTNTSATIDANVSKAKHSGAPSAAAAKMDISAFFKKQ